MTCFNERYYELWFCVNLFDSSYFRKNTGSKVHFTTLQVFAFEEISIHYLEMDSLTLPGSSWLYLFTTSRLYLFTTSSSTCLPLGARKAKRRERRAEPSKLDLEIDRATKLDMKKIGTRNCGEVVVFWVHQNLW